MTLTQALFLTTGYWNFTWILSKLYFTSINYSVLLYVRIFTYCPEDIKIFRIASITAHAQLRRSTGKKEKKNKHSSSHIGYQYHTHWFTTGLASSHPSDKSLIFKNGGCVWHCLRPLPPRNVGGGLPVYSTIFRPLKIKFQSRYKTCFYSTFFFYYRGPFPKYPSLYSCSGSIHYQVPKFSTKK
jgi:hypothetical protein